MSLFRTVFCTKDKNGNRQIFFNHYSGLPSVPYNAWFMVVQNDTEQRLEIKKWMSKSEPFYIRYEQVLNIEVIHHKESIQKKQSVVGNAIVGDMLAGKTGAVIGAMDALQPKTKTIACELLSITYRPTSTVEGYLSKPKQVCFICSLSSLRFGRFVKELKTKCNIEDKPKPQPKIGGYL